MDAGKNLSFIEKYQKNGCLALAMYALGGILFITGLFPLFFGVPLLLGLIMIIVGFTISHPYRCSNCKNPVSNKEVRLCPACGDGLSNQIVLEQEAQNRNIVLAIVAVVITAVVGLNAFALSNSRIRALENKPMPQPVNVIVQPANESAIQNKSDKADIFPVLVEEQNLRYSKPTPPEAMTPTPHVKPAAIFINKGSADKSFHKEGCEYLNNNTEEILIKDAAQRGYKPCSFCKPLLIRGNELYQGTHTSTYEKLEHPKPVVEHSLPPIRPYDNSLPGRRFVDTNR